VGDQLQPLIALPPKDDNIENECNYLDQSVNSIYPKFIYNRMIISYKCHTMIFTKLWMERSSCCVPLVLQQPLIPPEHLH
jgi:hypothetical protein